VSVLATPHHFVSATVAPPFRKIIPHQSSSALRRTAYTHSIIHRFLTPVSGHPGSEFQLKITHYIRFVRSKPRIFRCLSAELRDQDRAAVKERVFRSEQAFLFIACEREVWQGANTEATEQFEARVERDRSAEITQ
jgi:hypothetical protein